MTRKKKFRPSLETRESRGDRIAISIANVLGSLPALFTYAIVILCYLTWNLDLIPGLKPFDPSPFPKLDAILSITAIFLSVSVLISQNRQRKLEKIREHVEFEVNVRAENEITKILEMLHEMQQKMGIRKTDEELEEMKEKLDVNALHEHIRNNPE